jgi:hypothetical protein
MSEKVVIYHGNCYDGFGAAWAAWRALGDSARYIPALYGEALPAEAWDCDLYIVDFSYPRAALEGRALDPSHVLNVTEFRVLDHHKTAQADLAGLPFCTFDMDKSGAMLAWEHFHPSEPAPRLIEYVQDRDLWRFQLKGSREVSAWLRSWPFDFDAWSRCSLALAADLDGVIAQGASILRFQDEQVRVMCRQAVMREVGGHRVPVTNATVFFSEVGEELCRAHPDAPFAAYYLDRADGKRQWGLRSRNGFDVSAVAKQYGGGGHPAAAGFTEERHP